MVKKRFWPSAALCLMLIACDDDTVRPEAPEPTVVVAVSGVLDVDAPVAASILEQDGALFGPLLDADVWLPLLRSGADGDRLGILGTDRITLEATVDGVPLEPVDFEVRTDPFAGDGSTLAELMDWARDRLGTAGVDLEWSIAADGRLEVSTADMGASLDALAFRATGRRSFSETMEFVPTAGVSRSREVLLVPADEVHRMTMLRYEDGVPLNLAFTTGSDGRRTTTLAFGGIRGGQAIEDVEPLEVDADLTTLGNFLAWIRQGLRLGGSDGSGIEIDGDGSIRIKGRSGTENALSSLAIREFENLNSNVDRIRFEVVSDPNDAPELTASVVIVDPDLATHRLTLRMRRSAALDRWDWVAGLEGTATIDAGARGHVRFQGPQANALETEDGGQALVYRPGPSADPITLFLVVGEQGLRLESGGGRLQLVAIARPSD